MTDGRVSADFDGGYAHSDDELSRRIIASRLWPTTSHGPTLRGEFRHQHGAALRQMGHPACHRRRTREVAMMSYQRKVALRRGSRPASNYQGSSSWSWVSRQHTSKSNGMARCLSQNSLLASLKSGLITRPTGRMATTSPPARDRAEATLCARAPEVKVSSTSRTCSPRSAASTPVSVVTCVEVIDGSVTFDKKLLVLVSQSTHSAQRSNKRMFTDAVLR